MGMSKWSEYGEIKSALVKVERVEANSNSTTTTAFQFLAMGKKVFLR
jgi:hypothetical protein